MIFSSSPLQFSPHLFCLDNPPFSLTLESKQPSKGEKYNNIKYDKTKTNTSYLVSTNKQKEKSQKEVQILQTCPYTPQESHKTLNLNPFYICKGLGGYWQRPCAYCFSLCSHDL